jgi:hypothetical protein
MPMEQAGFKKGHGMNKIANLRWIMKKAWEHHKNVYLCFIDYSKALDSVDHLEM